MEGFSRLSRLARFSSFELDLRARELRKHGLRMRLPEQSFQILAMLLEHSGELVAREEIQAKLWPHDTVVEFDHSINTAIRRLRDALNDSADNPRFVETLARRGYRFIAPVEWVQPSPPRGVPVPEAAPAPESSEAPEDLCGRMVSHYRILHVLGRGGMGVVYKAEDTKLGRPVALKFLPEELAGNPLALERFQREARAASTLDHPSICTIYEIGEHEGQPFIAMQFLEGHTLKEHLAGRALQADELLEIAVQIAEALQTAHAKGIIHRDIKPTNIFLTQHGRLKVLDFGLAKLIPPRRRVAEVVGTPAQAAAVTTDDLTSPGIALGTLAYMSPEQLRGESVDERGDIFSLGVLLYESLTGRLPFRGETSVDIQYAILRQPPTPLRSLVPEISPAWEQLVERCLAKAPEQRYGSLAEVLAALRRTAAPAVQAEKSVAVLYFENVSEAKEDEYFRDGITEDIITELSKIGELWVFSRSSVLAYRDRPMTAAQVGQQLNASYVLEGSLRRLGSRLRLTAQLVETRTARSVWAERYDRQWEDVFAIQDEIAQSIARALRVMLTDQEKRAIEKVPTADVQAYDYYLRGRKFFHQFRRKGFEFARQMFGRAIEIDPRYARAYAGIADCCAFLYMYWESSDTNLEQADAASRKALELDPELAEAHASRGLVVSLKKQYEDAQAEFEIAMRLDPRLFEAYYFLARSYYAQGKLVEAVEWFEKASRARPEDYQAPMLLASASHGLGRTAEAEAAYRRGFALAQKHLELHPGDSRALYFGANALCQLAERERSLEWVGRALTLEAEEPQVLYNVACVYALLGETERAIDCLEKSITHAGWQRAWMEHDPDLASLRSHPRFQSLIRQSQEPSGS